MNKKRLLALVLTLVIVFSSMTAAFAQENPISADAQALTTIGMLQGDGNGVNSQYLATSPTRLQSAIMFLRLKGLENEALAFTGTNNFADAANYNWEGGKAVMAYLKANPQLGWIGSGSNMFNPNATIDAKSYYKVLLEAIGYKQNSAEVIGDFSWDNVIDFAATKGLVNVANAVNFTVNDLATATIEGLKAAVKGGVKSLATTMVEAGKMDAQKAIAVGIYTAPVDKTGPKVASITMNNLKEAVIKFNEKVDKTTAETAGNYLPAGTPVLGEDGMTVVLSLTTPIATNASDVDFTVKNVKDAAANVMDSTDMTVKAFDVTLPVADKVELTGPQQFTITFSEPMLTAGTVLVENGIYGATPSLDGKVVTVNLAAPLAAGSYKVKVAGYKDFAGYEALSKDFTLSYVKDTTPVTVAVKKATQTYVVVEFSKAVKGDQLTTATFYHTFTAWNPNTVTQEDGTAFVAANYYKTAKLGFTTYTIPAGTTNLVVAKAVGSSTAIVDQWGNNMASDATLAVTVTADTTAPTATKVEATAENKIAVTFSEDVQGADLAANYTIKGADGKVVTPVINTVDYTNTDNVYKAVLNLSAALSGGNYTVDVKDVKDLALAANKIATVTLAFSVTDKTPATVASAAVVETLNDGKVDYIYLTFSEAMATSGAGSILDKANYRLDQAMLADTAKIELFGSAKQVKITLPDQTTTLVGASRLTVGQIADATGNRMVAFATPVTVTPDTAPTVASVKTIALNKIEITVNGLLATVSADGITVTKGVYTDTLAAISFTKDAETGKTIITGTVKANEALATPDQIQNQIDIVANKLISETGKAMVAAPYATINDGVAPSIVSVVDSTTVNKFDISYNEALVEISSALTATEFVVVDKDGKTLTANVDYTTAINGTDAKVINVTLIGSKYAGYTGKLTVSTKSAITYFGDDLNANTVFNPGTDNASAAFAAKEVTIQ